MLGAIIGDVIGSVYEFGSEKTKDFCFFEPGCRATDDSVLTVCVGCACAEADCSDEDSFKETLKEKMYEIARLYPDAGYGKMFYMWLMEDDAPAYNGYTNGAAMRVSPCAWAADTLQDAEKLAKWSAEITHDHPEGIKGAQAVAAAIFMARTGRNKEEIRKYIENNYYNLDFTIEDIRPGYSYDLTCEGSVPQAIVSFLDAEDYEDAIRNAISLGGDGDTQAAIAGSIAEAFFGIPQELEEEVFKYLDEDLAEYYFGYADYLYR